MQLIYERHVNQFRASCWTYKPLPLRPGRTEYYSDALTISMMQSFSDGDWSGIGLDRSWGEGYIDGAGEIARPRLEAHETRMPRPGVTVWIVQRPQLSGSHFGKPVHVTHTCLLGFNRAVICKASIDPTTPLVTDAS